MRCLLLLALPVLLANAAPDAPVPVPTATPAQIPPPIKAMLDAALDSGDESAVATIVKYARVADPASGDAVQAIADKWRRDRQAAHIRALREARFTDLWTGKVEVGGFLTTGNSRTVGISGALDLTREGLQWRHKLRGQVDYQKSFDVVTREHYLAAYEPNYKIDDRAYIYGATQYESDRILGYYDRVSASVGAGYSAIKAPRISLDLELGPAYRYTAFTDDRVEASLAARGSLDFKWQLSNGIKISQQASAYVQRYNSTVSGTTAVNAKLIGPLSAQLSYNVQYESLPTTGAVTTDTTSRAGLVYSF